MLCGTTAVDEAVYELGEGSWTKRMKCTYNYQMEKGK